jgi:asparagine synthetase B (glutamine-hydrolysing)
VSAADGLPFGALFDPAGSDASRRTKLALRAAFAREVPREVLDREKASFPVPFHRWMHATAAHATRSNAAARIFTPAALATIREDPSRCWGIAWPVLNVCLWAERWWGDGAQASAASRRGTAESSRLVYSCAGSYST